MPASVRVLLAVSLLAVAASAQTPASVVIGAGTAEWDARPATATDPVGDATASADLTTLWVESDADFLTIAFEVAAPVLLSDGNALRLVIDADDDASTGTAIHGLGAELVWTFGQRGGTLRTGASTRSVLAGQIGLWTAPQVTATRFELALPRQPGVGVLPVVAGSRLRLAVLGGTGDAIPAEAGGLVVDLSDAPREREAVDLSKEAPGHVRVLAYNVLRDRLLHPTYEAAYRRVLQAVRPDLVIASEVYDSAGSTVAARLAALLGEPPGSWFGAKAGPDVIVAARTPVTLVAEVTGNGLFRVQRPEGEGPDWIVAALHPPCCTNDAGRQAELDALIARLRDLRANGTIPADAPLVVGGDMNLVGDSRQLATLFAGDILDEATHGPDFAPDLDGSALTDAAPRATGVPAAFTWRSTGQSFPPGQLDYVGYSDAVLDAGRSFVLYTPGLTDAERTALGLDLYDAAGLAGGSEPFPSDHLPVVVDLYTRPITGVAAAPGVAVEILGLAPNPARGPATLRLRTAQGGAVEVALYDPLGRRVRQWGVEVGPGTHAVALDVAGLAAGVYVARVTAPGGTATRRVVVAG